MTTDNNRAGTPARRYDVVVVGAGMVGAAFAGALGESKLRVAILEVALPDMGWSGETIDLRVSAISRASQQLFSTLGVWNSMCQRRVSPFRDMQVWDSAGRGAVHFDSADIGEPALGYIIENTVIRLSLLERLNDFENIDLLCPATVTGYTERDGVVTVQLADGASLETSLLVGADGGRSRVRELAGISCHGWEYDQRAVVTTVTTALSHQMTAWQRFLPNGPLAFLPLSGGESSIVWSTTPEHAESLLNLTEEAFALELEMAFESRLGAIVSVGERKAFPLKLQHAESYIKPGVALIGDAAHTIHPLAGQGVNLGFMDAATLAEVLLDGCGRGKNPGRIAVLRRYERWRKGSNLAMMAAMEGIQRLFGAQSVPVTLARNTGMNVVQRLGPLKKLIMSHAMGTAVDVPQSMRQIM
jgi:2-octaprenylphenol hydroxylase